MLCNRNAPASTSNSFLLSLLYRQEKAICIVCSKVVTRRISKQYTEYSNVHFLFFRFLQSASCTFPFASVPHSVADLCQHCELPFYLQLYDQPELIIIQLLQKKIYVNHPIDTSSLMNTCPTIFTTSQKLGTYIVP